MSAEYFEARERALLGERYERLYAAPQETAARGVTVSALRTTPEEFAARADFPLRPSPFCKAAFVVECPDFKPGRHPYHHAGVFYSQEPSASSTAPLLGVRPGMRVLDLCAAPGGKSSQLAAALGGQGLLVSNEFVAARAEVLRLARLEGAPAEFYPTLRKRGLVRVAPGSTHHVRIEAEDDCGNVSTLEFDIRGGDARLRPERDTTAVAVRRNRDTQLRIGDEATLRIPAGALHESLFARPVRLDNPATGSGTVAVLSPAYRFLDSDTPLAGEVMLSLQLFVPEQTAPHVTLAVRNRRGKLVRLGGTYNAGRLTARIRTAGEWLAVADTVPPTVRPLFTPGGDLSRSGALRFRLGDNFSGIASYDLYVDGEWVPCDRYPMQGTLEYHFTGAPTHAEHSVLLVVKDGCNNKTRWEGTFRR